MKEHKYNNTVIQSKGGEHGKRVIEWWKEQGVDTKNFSGKIEKGWYYGLINGEFAPHHSNAVIKASATIIELPESKPQDLIGRKVRGFSFEGSLEEMRKCIGQVGIVKEYDLDNTYLVEFGDKLGWYYPASLIHEHFVEEEITTPQIIDLSNVEGVKMMVSDDEERWVKEIVIAKYADRFIDCNFSVWRFAKPIEVKKVTMQEVEELFGCKVEIVKEVSNG